MYVNRARSELSSVIYFFLHSQFFVGWFILIVWFFWFFLYRKLTTSHIYLHLTICLIYLKTGKMQHTKSKLRVLLFQLLSCCVLNVIRCIIRFIMRSLVNFVSYTNMLNLLKWTCQYSNLDNISHCF
jgi:hypothetical protein